MVLAFLLMAKATVMTVTVSLSTIASGASLMFGAVTVMIIPIVITATAPRTTTTKMVSWLGSW